MRLLSNESGAVLVLVLATLLILAIATTILVGDARMTMLMTERVRYDARASATMKSGVSLAVDQIYRKVICDSSVMISGFTFDSCGDVAVRPVTTGDPLPEGSILVSIEDEQGKINLNCATREDLLRIPDMNSQVADAILDWCDSDEQPRSAGTESSYYRSLSVPYSCKNAPFESTEELLLVRGINRDLYGILRKLVTVYGDGAVNINTCSLEVLVALGLDESLAKRIILLRAGPDGVAESEDDLVFLSQRNILNEIKDRLVLDDKAINQLTSLLAEERLCVNSRFFRITVTNNLIPADSSVDLTSVIEFTEKAEPKIRFWSVF